MSVQSVVATLLPSQVPEAHPFAILAQAEGSADAAKNVLSVAIVGSAGIFEGFFPTILMPENSSSNSRLSISSEKEREVS
jgi:hypothetical protein